MKFFNNKILLTLIFLVVLMFSTTSVNAAYYTLDRCNGIGDGLNNNDNFYGNRQTVFVYDMEDDKGNTLYCLEPGKYASSIEGNDLYEIKVNGYNQLSKICTGTIEFKINEGNTTKSVSVTKEGLLFHIISELYNYGSNEGSNMVLKQLMVWKYIDKISETTSTTEFWNIFRFTQKDRSKIIKDVKTLTGDDLTETLNQILGTVNDENYDNENAPMTKVGRYYEGSLLGGIIKDQVYTQTVWQKNVTFYIPVDANGNEKTSYQILIGPPTDTPTTSIEYTYKVYNKYGNNTPELTNSGNYTGSKSVGPTTKAGYTYSNYYTKNGTSKSGANCSFSNENVEIVFYHDSVYTLTVSHIVYDSSGNEVDYAAITSKNVSYNVVSGGSQEISIKDTDLYDGTTSGTRDGNVIKIGPITGNMTVIIKYRVGRITLTRKKVDLNANYIGYDSKIYGYRFSETELPLVNDTIDWYKYKGYQTTGHEILWNWESNPKIPKSKEDTEVTAYYSLRHIFVSHLIKTSNGLEKIKSSYFHYFNSSDFKNDIEDDKLSVISTSKFYEEKEDLNDNNENKYVKLNYIGGQITQKNKAVDALYTWKINLNWYTSLGSGVSIGAKGNSYTTATSTFGSATTTKNIAKLSSNESTDTSSVHFYYEEIKPMKVYVRHFVKDSNGDYVQDKSIKNNSEYVIESDGTAIIVPNGYNERKTKYINDGKLYTSNINDGFSEKYILDKTDTIVINRSGTIVKDGHIYNCVGFYSGTNLKQNPTPTNKIGKTSISVTDKNQYYIDYFYEKIDYTKEKIENKTINVDESIGLNSRLRFVSKTIDDNNAYKTIYDYDESANTAYCPVLENLKPFVDTKLCMVRNLVYELSTITKTSSTGSYTISYKVAKYTALGLAISNDTVNVNGITGDANELVYSGSSTTVEVTDSNSKIKDTIKGTVTELKQKAAGIFNSYINYSNKTKQIDIINDALAVCTNKKSDESMFSDSSNFNVSQYRYNGLRNPTGSVKYYEYTYEYDFAKTQYVINRDNFKVYTSNINDENAMDVNIYTPMSIDKSTIISTGDYVNHSNKDDSSVIQKGVVFTLTPNIKSNNKLEYNNNLPNLDKYLKGYIVVFGFDIKYNDGTEVVADTPIWVNPGDSIEATPVAIEGEAGVSQLQEEITTIAVTKNTATDLLKKAFGITSQTTYSKGNKDLCNNSIKKSDSSGMIIGNNNTIIITDSNSVANAYEMFDINMNADSVYFVKNITSTYVIARLYDFKITDCYDVDFKNVFRKNNVSTNVNESTKVYYYSGTRKMLLEYGINKLSTRSENTILPLGPYKHTQYDYVKAPKLGYRISFDVKTYGYYAPSDTDNSKTRTIRITPSYYYISKDGKTFNNNIKLYYKNSSGKYVTFDESNYNISFKPNDGYRNLSNESVTNSTKYLSDKLVNISVGNSFTLDSKTMMTTDNTNFIQAWYGEFKVPNSTIVVDATNPNLNNPLTDGYLGVIFKIECIDSDGLNDIIVMYDQNDKTKGSDPNTSQWDYEGYMGVTAGQEYSTSLQLEKGTWDITEDIYKAIKGTVVLYDLDERASNDFD